MFDPLIQQINNSITAGSVASGYNEVDVYGKFLNYIGGSLILYFDLAKAAIEPHPTDAGHYLIYRAHLLPATSLVYGVTIDKPVVDLLVGDTMDLYATISPSDATNMNVTWTSSNEAVATVDSNGFVTAIGKGTADIKVKTEDRNFTAKCTVTVEETGNISEVNLPKTGSSIDLSVLVILGIIFICAGFFVYMRKRSKE